MKKCLIDFGCGMATIYTPYPNPEVRFMILSETLPYLHDLIRNVKICSIEYEDRYVGFNERLDFDDKVYIWDANGGRKMIEPSHDLDWDYRYSEQVQYIKEGI